MAADCSCLALALLGTAACRRLLVGLRACARLCLIVVGIAVREAPGLGLGIGPGLDFGIGYGARLPHDRAEDDDYNVLWLGYVLGMK